MDLKLVSSIFGVLGFFISVATFVLTRLERRKKLLVELYTGDTSQFSDELTNYNEDDYVELIKIRVTNIGGQPVVINPESFYVAALNKKIVYGDNDWHGIEKVPSPLNVGSSVEVALYVDDLIELLGFKELDKYCNPRDALKTVVPLVVGLSDHSGKKFFSRNFKYFYYVNALERVT